MEGVKMKNKIFYSVFLLLVVLLLSAFPVGEAFGFMETELANGTGVYLKNGVKEIKFNWLLTQGEDGYYYFKSNQIFLLKDIYKVIKIDFIIGINCNEDVCYFALKKRLFDKKNLKSIGSIKGVIEKIRGMELFTKINILNLQ